MSNKFMPSKPKFDRLWGIHTSPGWSSGITEDHFDEWYDKDIKPLFDTAIEVKASVDLDDVAGAHWYAPDKNVIRKELYSHKALLICIEPIKRETAENILRELLYYEEAKSFGMSFVERLEIIDRAKSFLNKNKT